MEILQKIKEAVRFTKEGNYEQAEAIYEELLEKFPDDSRVLPFLGWFYIAQKKYQDAVDVLEKARESALNTNIATGLGISYYALNEFYNAYTYLKFVADNTEKTSEEVLYKLITCSCESTTKVFDIYKYAQIMVELYPNSPATWECYTLASLCAGKFNEAEDYCLSLINNGFKHHSLYLNAGLVQEVAHLNYELALQCYLQAYELAPTGSALYNIGLAYSRMHDFENAEKYLLMAYEKDESLPEINKSLYILYAGQKMFEKAYYHFQKSVTHFIKDKQNLWAGESCINSTLYIVGDQGIGDLIMYSRYLFFIRDKFKKIIVSVPSGLISLFKHNFPFVEFVEYEEQVVYDKTTLMTLLPYLLNIDYDNIPLKDGYLKPLCQVSQVQTPELKVGIVWEAGGTKLRGSFDRSINPALLKPIFELKGLQVYSLQVESGINACEKYPQIIDLGSKFNDFSQTAEAIMDIDLIISVDTSVAHLAGALGKKTWILLPEYADWRWFDDVNTTSWYSSVKLFRQSTRMDWISVVDNVVKELIVEQG